MDFSCCICVPFRFVYSNNKMHRSVVWILPIDKLLFISSWNIEVNSDEMNRIKRQPSAARINRLFRSLVSTNKIFVFDDKIYNVIAKQTKIPRIIVRKCVRDHQPFVRLEPLIDSPMSSKAGIVVHGNY